MLRVIACVASGQTVTADLCWAGALHELCRERLITPSVGNEARVVIPSQE